MPPRKRTRRAASAEPARLQADAQQNAIEVHAAAARLEEQATCIRLLEAQIELERARAPEFPRGRGRRRRRSPSSSSSSPSSSSSSRSSSSASSASRSPSPRSRRSRSKNSKNQKVPARRLAVIAIARVLRQRAPVNGGTWRMSTSTQSTPGSRSAWRKCGGH